MEKPLQNLDDSKQQNQDLKNCNGTQHKKYLKRCSHGGKERRGQYC